MSVHPWRLEYDPGEFPTMSPRLVRLKLNHVDKWYHARRDRYRRGFHLVRGPDG